MARKLKKRITKRKNIKKHKNGGFYFIRLFSIWLLIGIGLFYLFQVGKGPTAIYEIDDLQRQISNLEDQKKLLELKAVELRSMSKIEERVDDLKMIAVEKVKYIENNKAMAKK